LRVRGQHTYAALPPVPLSSPSPLPAHSRLCAVEHKNHPLRHTPHPPLALQPPPPPPRLTVAAAAPPVVTATYAASSRRSEQLFPLVLDACRCKNDLVDPTLHRVDRHSPRFFCGARASGDVQRRWSLRTSSWALQTSQRFPPCRSSAATHATLEMQHDAIGMIAARRRARCGTRLLSRSNRNTDSQAGTGKLDFPFTSHCVPMRITECWVTGFSGLLQLWSLLVGTRAPCSTRVSWRGFARMQNLCVHAYRYACVYMCRKVVREEAEPC
jgi:hypothetical protein